MARLLEAHPDLDAVFLASDLMASGALTYLSQRGVRVPQDLAVVGFDDLEIAETTQPPLTTVAQPVGEMAARAGQMLADLLAGVPVPAEPTVFEARLVRRASS